MLIDNFLLFEPLAGTAVTSGAASTNVIDLLNPRDIGIGDDPAIKLTVLVVAASFSSGSSSKLNTQIQGAPGASSAGTWTTIVETGDIGAASLASGTQVMNIDMPSILRAGNNMGFGTPGNNMIRLLRMNFSVGTTSFSAGSITAFLNIDNDALIAYPPGLAVLN